MAASEKSSPTKRRSPKPEVRRLVARKSLVWENKKFRAGQELKPRPEGPKLEQLRSQRLVVEVGPSGLNNSHSGVVNVPEDRKVVRDDQARAEREQAAIAERERVEKDLVERAETQKQNREVERERLKTSRERQQAVRTIKR